MIKVQVYLNFPGNTEEAFNFYRTVFGGGFNSVVRFKDMPMGMAVAKADEDKIMHIALPIGGSDILMGSDALASHGREVVEGNNVRISLNPDSKAEADRVFAALSAGGAVEMAMANQPWGDYYGSVKDRFGVFWMVNYAVPKSK